MGKASTMEQLRKLPTSHRRIRASWFSKRIGRRALSRECQRIRPSGCNLACTWEHRVLPSVLHVVEHTHKHSCTPEYSHIYANVLQFNFYDAPNRKDLFRGKWGTCDLGMVWLLQEFPGWMQCNLTSSLRNCILESSAYMILSLENHNIKYNRKESFPTKSNYRKYDESPGSTLTSFCDLGQASFLLQASESKCH